MIKFFSKEGDIDTRLRKGYLLYKIYECLLKPERKGSKDLKIEIKDLNLKDTELIEHM